MEELFSLQGNEQGGAIGGGDIACHNKPDSMPILEREETNQDIEVISLETQDDKDS